MSAGTRVIAFLEHAPPTSQMRRALPGGTYYRLSNARWGLVELPDATTEKVFLEAVAGWVTLADDHELDEAAQASLRRRLVFLELGADSPRLVEDVAAALPELTGLSRNIKNDERSTIVRVLGREDLPERVRIGLVNAIARMKLRSLAPALHDLPGAGPDLRRATIRARAQLGEARNRNVLVDSLKDEDPVTRTAAIHELMDTGGRTAVGEIAEIAVNDPDRGVRLTAIEALGSIPSPTALDALGKTFKDADLEIRRQSARSIHAIGGREAATLLSDLAFDAPPGAQQQALALLLTLGIPRTDPLVTRIRDKHPNQAVRNLAEKGIEAHSH
jgi:HEAT repeat protein